MSKKCGIVQPYFFPYYGYFQLINLADHFVFYDDVQFTKRDWRNRNKIKSRLGEQWLTIPVKSKGRYTQKINEVEISDANWGLKHWRQIEASYKKAPHYQEISDWLSPVIKDCKFSNLSEINRSIITKICGYLKIKTNIKQIYH